MEHIYISYDSCLAYFYKLALELKDSHVIIKSCNKDSSMYLVPIGTEGQITYTSKPVNSYRISNHWNWYANVRKCPNSKYIQCWNVDLPKPNRRMGPGKPSIPIIANCVAKIGDDGKYHTVFGEGGSK